MIDRQCRMRLRDVLLSAKSPTEKWEDIDCIVSQKRSFYGDKAIDIAFTFWSIYDPEYPANAKSFLSIPTHEDIEKRCALFLSSCQEYVEPSNYKGLFAQLKTLFFNDQTEASNTMPNKVWPFVDEAHYLQAVNDVGVIGKSYTEECE